MGQESGAKSKSSESGTEIDIDLKDPALAAFLAWLVPGAGHFYQGRTAKGVLLMTCILGTFLFGMLIGDGRVVYAQWESFDKRWPYYCQLPAGAVALPALVQNMRGDNLFGDMYAPPPEKNKPGDEQETLNDLNYRLNHRFEIGTVYTMIAGLLNVLAIYDAWGGPVIVLPREPKKKRRREKEGDGTAGEEPAAADSLPTDTNPHDVASTTE